jgi:diadenylate cyclase
MTMLAAALPFDPLARLNLRAALDILIIATLIYYVLMLLRGTRAVQMVVGIALLVAFYRTAQWARLEMVEWLLTTVLPYVAIALIVLFQPEIRRALSRVGRNLSLLNFTTHNPKSAYDDIVMASEYFSQNRIGALMAIERHAGLRTYIESGVPLDAKLSYDLLLSIFRPGSPLHDGAVIIQGSRGGRLLLAPVAQSDDFEKTRHAAPGRHRNHRGERRRGRAGLRGNRSNFDGNRGHD